MITRINFIIMKICLRLAKSSFKLFGCSPLLWGTFCCPTQSFATIGRSNANTLAIFGASALHLLAHSVSLFTGQECPKISMTSNPRQNCRIGQLTTKKWFFSPDQFGLRRKRKGKSGEIRSLLETLGSTL